MVRILLVEDETLLRELLSDDLSDAGFAVTEAATGDEALELLRGDPAFDLMLTDIRMPGTIDGWTLGRHAREIIASIRIVYATGYSEQGPELGAHERTINKPFRHEQILALIGDLGIAP